MATLSNAPSTCSTPVYQEKQPVDGFELWDRERFVYRFPKSERKPQAPPDAIE